MARVTMLRAARGGRYVVHLDGVYLGTVTQAAVARHHLHLDRQLNDDEAQALRADAILDGALVDAYRLLAERCRGRQEMAGRLAAKGHPEDVVATVVSRLLADGSLDDAAFAAAYVADKRRLSGWGRERITAGLRQLGVAVPVIEAAVGTPESTAADEALRASAVLSRMGAPGRPLEASRRRAFDRLRRRGFSTAVAYAAIQGWIAGAAADGERRDPGDRQRQPHDEESADDSAP